MYYMGTDGIYCIKYKGRYFVFPVYSDATPECLGKKLVNDIRQAIMNKSFYKWKDLLESAYINTCEFGGFILSNENVERTKEINDIMNESISFDKLCEDFRKFINGKNKIINEYIDDLYHEDKIRYEMYGGNHIIKIVIDGKKCKINILEEIKKREKTKIEKILNERIEMKKCFEKLNININSYSEFCESSSCKHAEFKETLEKLKSLNSFDNKLIDNRIFNTVKKIFENESEKYKENNKKLNIVDKSEDNKSDNESDTDIESDSDNESDGNYYSEFDDNEYDSDSYMNNRIFNKKDYGKNIVIYDSLSDEHHIKNKNTLFLSNTDAYSKYEKYCECTYSRYLESGFINCDINYSIDVDGSYCFILDLDKNIFIVLDENDKNNYNDDFEIDSEKINNDFIKGRVYPLNRLPKW